MGSQTKDKTTPISKETGLLGSADWINIALDWPVTVYFLRANQRHPSPPQLQRSSISALPFPHTFLAPRQMGQSIRQTISLFLSSSIPPSCSSSTPSVIFGTLSVHHQVKFYLTHQVSHQNNPDARYNPDQQLLSGPPGPRSLIFMMPANNWKDIHHALIDVANQVL